MTLSIIILQQALWDWKAKYEREKLHYKGIQSGDKYIEECVLYIRDIEEALERLEREGDLTIK